MLTVSLSQQEPLSSSLPVNKQRRLCTRRSVTTDTTSSTKEKRATGKIEMPSNIAYTDFSAVKTWNEAHSVKCWRDMTRNNNTGTH